MRSLNFLGALGATIMLSSYASAATLDDVKTRGNVRCGINTGLVGFSAPDANGVWQGFDVDFCRAVAAAVLNDPMKVEFVPTTGQTRFTALASGEIDLLARNSTWSFSRDVDLKLTFVGTNYYDGQAFMVRKELGVTSAKELDGASICIEAGTTLERTVAEYFRQNNMTYEQVPVETGTESQRQYLAHACDVNTAIHSTLKARLGSFENPSEHMILPEIISRDPFSLAVRQGDDQWADIVRWTFNALVVAEDLGISKENVDQMAATPSDVSEINRLLGNEGDLGTMLGLDAKWAQRAISASGNYGEIFAANLGVDTPIGLERGYNALWKDGGLMYSPPFH